MMSQSLGLHMMTPERNIVHRILFYMEKNELKAPDH
jgi:hypothetical protein